MNKAMAKKIGYRKYIIIDSINGKVLINAVYNDYNRARLNARLYNEKLLSTKEILNIK